MPVDRIIGLLLTAAVAASLISVQTSAAWASGVRLAGGKSEAVIVTAREMLPLEQLAVTELKAYLAKSTGHALRVLEEIEKPSKAPRIYVGRTEAARKLGIDAAKLGDQEWIVRTNGQDLYLVGGAPRGTLYAVYHFLEDVVGVHWWNAFEETVPSKPRLTIPQIDMHGKPAFEVRRSVAYYPSWLQGGPLSHRNRLFNWDTVLPNGQPAASYSKVSVYWDKDNPVRNEPFGGPWMVHTFAGYVTDEDLARHPEWAAEINGVRSVASRGLCLTNNALRDHFVTKLQGFIHESRAMAAKYGIPTPYIFDISENDVAGWCRCVNCKAVVKREGSDSGPYIEFLNYISDRIRHEHPDVVIDSLAYLETRTPPKSLRPRKNVRVRYCTELMNIPCPITDPSNKVVLEQLKAWQKTAADRATWQYVGTYGFDELAYGRPAYGMPIPLGENIFQDYRTYRDLGIRDVFSEQENWLTHCHMTDMRLWLTMKAMEDPDQDAHTAIKTFTDGFYGPAGRHVRQYLDALQQAYERKPSHIAFYAQLPDFKYLDLQFTLAAEKIFDKAASAVAGDAVLSQRVRYARFGLDRAALYLWPGLVREWVNGGGAAQNIPLDRQTLIDRVEQTYNEQLDLRCSPEGMDRKPEEKARDHEMALFKANEYVPMRPAREFAGYKREDVFDYPATSATFRLDSGDGVSLVPDPDAEAGKAIRVPCSLPLIWTLKPSWGPSSQIGKGIGAGDTKGSGYNWYEMGPVDLDNAAAVYFRGEAGARMYFRETGKYDLYANLKFEQSSIGADGPGEAAVFVDRVVLVRSNATESTMGN